MPTFSKSDLAGGLLLELLSQQHAVNDKLLQMEKRYNTSFELFEVKAKGGDESFEQWDDYMEWKAYLRTAKELEEQIRALKHDDFQVA